MIHFEAPENEWPVPKIDREKSISITRMTKEQIEKENQKMRSSGFVPGIASRSIDQWTKRPF